MKTLFIRHEQIPVETSRIHYFLYFEDVGHFVKICKNKQFYKYIKVFYDDPTIKIFHLL